MTLQNALVSVLPIASMIAMGGLFLCAAYRYFVKPSEPALEKKALPIRELALRVLLLFALSRLLIYGAGLVFAAIADEAQTYLTSLENFYVRWDARHYLNIASDWYVNEGDPQFRIVFYPLYPIIIRLFSPLFGGNMTASAFLVSNLCLPLSGWALYRLVEPGFGRKTASRALMYLMFSPLSLFFSLPFSESLFLMLTLASALMAQRRKFSFAIALGALCSATRLLGLLTAVPLFYEFIKLAREKETGRARTIICGFFLSCLVALGFVYYLLVNYQITGNPFQFLIHQREHWSQTFGSLYNTLSYTMQNMLSYDDEASRIGIWTTQFWAIIAVLTVMISTWRKQRPGDLAYSVLYVYAALAPTWLLSGARYLTALYTLYPMLALLTKRRWAHCVMMLVLIVLTCYGTYMYTIVGSLF